jgi:gluconolactonase
LPLPRGAQQPSNLCFGGQDFDVLFVSAVGKVWRRRLKTQGCNPFEAPVRAPVARL